jgi:hypothetical protein
MLVQVRRETVRCSNGQRSCPTSSSMLAFESPLRSLLGRRQGVDASPHASLHNRFVPRKPISR